MNGVDGVCGVDGVWKTTDARSSISQESQKYPDLLDDLLETLSVLARTGARDRLELLVEM